MQKHVMPTLLAAAILCSGAAAQAATFTGSAVGSWGSPSGTSSGDVFSISNGDNNSNAATSNFSFGSAVSGSFTNLFTFNGANSFTTPGETLFDIGSFSYRNGKTNNYPNISSIGLSILLTLTSPIASASTFTYNFAINVTPNTTGNNVTDGDIVSVMNGTTATTFTVSGTQYTLALKGFSSDGGLNVTTQFVSPEESTARADIYATITSKTLAVPEPASLALLGAGLCGVGLFRRRKVV